VKIIGIDPGASGGIAWRDTFGEIHCVDMPDTPKDILDLLYKACPQHESEGSFCLIEQVGGYMPGNSGPAAVKFARHCGHLDMALLAAGIPHETILPAKWEHAFIGKPNHPKIPKEVVSAERKRIIAERKRERKNKIKAKAQALFPKARVTLKTADALGILYFAMYQGGFKNGNKS
jgi:hypothetical protein